MSDIRKFARDYLDKMGFLHRNLGYGYIIAAAEVCTDMPEMRHKTCKLYQTIAGRCGTTGSRVERAIRHSIETSDIKRIPNSEFIARLLDAYEDEKELARATNTDEPFRK